MTGPEIALLNVAGGALSKFLGPSGFVARHEASLRLEEQRISEVRKEYENLCGQDHHLPPHVSFGFRRAISSAEEKHEEYSHCIRAYKKIPFYKVLTKIYSARYEIRKGKRALQDATALLLQAAREARDASQATLRDTNHRSSNASDGSEPNSRLEHERRMEEVGRWVGSHSSPSSDVCLRTPDGTEDTHLQNDLGQTESPQFEDLSSSADMTEIDVYSVDRVVVDK